MKKLSNTEADLKKVLLIKEVWCTGLGLTCWTQIDFVITK